MEGDFVEKLKEDSHSPAKLGVNYVPANFNAFAEAFNCPKNSKMN